MTQTCQNQTGIILRMWLWLSGSNCGASKSDSVVRCGGGGGDDDDDDDDDSGSSNNNTTTTNNNKSKHVLISNKVHYDTHWMQYQENSDYVLVILFMTWIVLFVLGHSSSFQY